MVGICDGMAGVVPSCGMEVVCIAAGELLDD